MESIELTADDTLALLALVDEGIATTLAVPGKFGQAHGALYPVTRELGSLDSSGIERAAWLLSQLGFSITDVATRSIPSDIGGVANEFYTVSATRLLSFHRYSLLGEALIIESLAAPWQTHVDRFYLHDDDETIHTALVSLHGPFGSQIMQQARLKTQRFVDG